MLACETRTRRHIGRASDRSGSDYQNGGVVGGKDGTLTCPRPSDFHPLTMATEIQIPEIIAWKRATSVVKVYRH